MDIYTQMNISPKMLKWAIRCYPPLLFQRIWVEYFGADFKSVKVKIKKSILNINYNRSIFGGTIFSAIDPFHAILFDQIFKQKGLKTRVWLKSAQIQYLKPGHGNLYFEIIITDEQIAEAETALLKLGKFVKTYKIEIYNAENVLCAVAQNEVYIRNLFHGEHQTIAY